MNKRIKSVLPEELGQAIEYFCDRVIRSYDLPQKIVTISTEYNIPSGTSETKRITWRRQLLPGDSYYYPDAYTPERIEHYRENIGRDTSHVTEYSEQQVQDMRNSFVESFERYQVGRSNSLIRNVKTSCRNYDNNPYLQCAIDPNLNCDCCPHYE